MPADTIIKIEIQGRIYKLPIRYKEGDKITAAEAVALEKLRSDNIRNIFAKVIRDNPPADLDAAFAAFADSYEFTKLIPKSALDPVEKAAYVIATNLANQLLRQRNIPKHTLQEGVFEDTVLRILNEQPGIMEEARQRVEAAERLASGLSLNPTT